MILIATKNEHLAHNWRRLLQDDFRIYDKHATDRRQLDICLKKVTIDIVLLNLSILSSEGVNDIAALHEIQPNTKLILLTPFHNDREEISAILFGAKAYLEENIDLNLLKKIVLKVRDGEIWVDRMFVSRLLKELEDITKVQHQEAKEIEKGVASMTPREEQIAELIATGASNRRIAEKLCISERTVKAHLGVIFRKIGISDRLQLALYMNKHRQLSSVWHPITENKMSRK